MPSPSQSSPHGSPQDLPPGSSQGSPHNPDIDVQALMRGLVHELRNPLSAILTAANLLHTTPSLDEESAMLLEVVQKESRRMNRILTEFASFVKPPRSHVEDFDLVKVLRDTVRELQSDGIIAEQIKVQDHLPTTLDVQGDVMQSHQALRHIIANAVEAMANGGAILLTGSKEGEKTLVFIEDTGENLDEKTLSQVFQPFFSTKPAATGLGLSIARGLIRAAGGDLTLENRLVAGHIEGVRVQVALPTSIPVSDETFEAPSENADALSH